VLCVGGSFLQSVPVGCIGSTVGFVEGGEVGFEWLFLGSRVPLWFCPRPLGWVDWPAKVGHWSNYIEGIPVGDSEVKKGDVLPFLVD
jgi:hypothetical protein